MSVENRTTGGVPPAAAVTGGHESWTATDGGTWVVVGGEAEGGAGGSNLRTGGVIASMTRGSTTGTEAPAGVLGVPTVE